ncbi:sigma-54-dependent Fis family transcriptional regulator [Kyrpidia sp.]|uniref:sigma-54-dependent Fis family transcriptional regulator n=1 Tax=Kyrpidia sp. TaxID=2073077 RepID=UPI00258CC75C|nr:sigma-54-dependent Fis family transcriptional regulator [Kyrpidia sp.]MCL6577386.1 sigma-54-dependent Fis family transcriptional regulator [Kyrpidia sp.]
MGDALVVKRFDEFHQLDRKLLQAWEQFMCGGFLPDQHRPVIASSWERCASLQVDPLKYLADLIPQEDLLLEKKEQNHLLLSTAKPYIEELFRYFCDEPFAIVLSDPEGVLIDGRYNRRVFGKLERQRFLPGSNWSEQSAGTNAVGTALAEGQPVQVFSAEHFCQGWHNWVCSASPIRDPYTRQIIGVLDMTGEKELVQAHDLYLITSQVYKLEQALVSHLREQNLLSLQALLDAMHDPFILFDNDGRVIRLNDPAKFLLRMELGKPLFPALDPPVHPVLGELSQKGMETTYRQENGVQWRVRILPYRFGTRMMGGIAVFHRLTAARQSQATALTRYRFDHLVTGDPNMLQLIELAKKSAFYEKTILITGETGTGKEVLAQSIHAYGPRRNGPFVAVNCGAIPKDLIASELFGYEGGAFTGAKSEGKQGKFVAADGGTIFLDEIGELPLDVQAYLLRVLEERVVVPVGGTRAIPVDVRVIAATHRNLKEMVRMGKFREDLYYRIHVITLTIPPLRERRGDIPLLVRHFINQSSGMGETCIDEEAMQALSAYSWPGNIRQLKNTIEQALFHADHGQIRWCDLPAEVRGRGPIPASGGKRALPRRRRSTALDRLTLEEALRRTRGNISETARLLSVSRMTIYRKIEEFRIDIEN